MSTIIYTIGHSNHSLEHFLSLLRQHEIEVLCDVRSTPASRYTPQFNSGTLEHVLPDHGIAYEFLGKQLGARAGRTIDKLISEARFTLNQTPDGRAALSREDFKEMIHSIDINHSKPANIRKSAKKQSKK